MSCGDNGDCPAGYSCVMEATGKFCRITVDAGGIADSCPMTDAGAAPATHITVHPDVATNSTSAVFQFTATPPGGTFLCTLDNGAATPCSSPDNLTVSVGTHTLKVQAVGPGVCPPVDKTGDSFTWIVDQTPPMVTSFNCPAAPTGNQISIGFSSNDAMATFICTLDGNSAACTAPAVNYTGLSQGPHTATVVAKDRSGNQSAPSVCMFTVSGVSPNAHFTNCPASALLADNISLNIAADVANTTFECSPAVNGQFTACTSPFVLSSLADGDYEVFVRGTAGGITDAVPGPCSFTIDAVPPTVTLIPPSPDEGATTGSTVQFKYSSDAPNATFKCGLDLSAPPTDDCDAAGKQFDNLPLGPHAFSIIAIDKSNVSSVVVVRNFIVGPGPGVQVTLVPATGPVDGVVGPDGDVVGPSGTIEFAVVGGALDVKYDCTTSGPGFDQTLPNCTSPVPWTGLAEDNYEFDVVATNTTTNETSTVKRVFHVDATPPVLTFVSPTDIVGNPISLLYTATDLVESVPITGNCLIDGTNFKCDAGIPLEISLEDGSHDLFLTAQDVWGNKTKTPLIRTLLVDATGPLITDFQGQATTCPSASDPDGVGKNFFQFTTNEQVSSLLCLIDGKPTTCQMISGTQGQVRWNNLDDGNHTLVIVATDVVGNPGPAPSGFSFTWTVDREPPTVTFFDPPSLSDPSGPGGNINFEIADNSPNGTFQNVEIVGCKIDLGTNSTVTDCNSTIVVTDGGGSDADFRATFAGLHDQNQEGGSFFHTMTIFAQDACGNVNAVNMGDGVAKQWTVDSTPDDIAFDPFTLTNSTNGGGPANVITSATGQVNFTLSDEHSNTDPPNPDEPAPTFTTCTITGTAAKTQDCMCDASPDMGVTWHCHAQYAGTDGTATITLNALDAVGNHSVPADANLSWIIDSSAPTVVFNTTPQVNGCTTDGNPNSVVVSKGVGDITFTSSESSAATPTAVGQATYTCALIDLTVGGSKVVSCPQTGSAPSTFTFHFDVADQSGSAPHIVSGHTYQLQVTAVDEVQNTTVASRFWAVDNDIPAVTFNAPNATPGFTNVISEVGDNGTGDPTATGTITTADVFGGSNGSAPWPKNSCTINGAVGCDLASYDVIDAALSEGQHTVTVHSSDCVGNAADYTLTFYLDRTPPNPTVTGLGPFQSATGTATVHFDVEEPGGGLSNVEQVFCALDTTAGFKLNDTGTGLPATSGTPPGPFGPCASLGSYSNVSSALPTAAGTGVFTADLTISGLSPGRHLLRFIASDHSHHLSSEQFVEFTVDFDGSDTGAFGHVVLIGQDFVAGNTATQNIIGNAAQLSRATTFGRPLRALVASFGSRDVDGTETANAENAMCTRLQAWHPGCTCGGLPTDCVFFDEQNFNPADPVLLSTNPTDTGSFANRVLGKDLVLFTDVDSAAAATAIGNLGGSTPWSDALTKLATNGIILIVTSGATDDPAAGFVATPTYLLVHGQIDVGTDLQGLREPFLECNSTDPLTARTDDEVANDDRWIDGFSQPTNGIRFINNERTASDTNMVSEVWDDNTGFQICPALCPRGPTGAVVLDKWFPQRTGVGPVYARVVDPAAQNVNPTVAFFQQPGQTLANVTHCLLNGDLTVTHDVTPSSIVSIGINSVGQQVTTSNYQSLFNLAPNEAVNIGVTVDTTTTNSTIDIPTASPGFQPSAIILSSGCSTLSWPGDAAAWDDSGVNLFFGAQCQLSSGSNGVIAMAVNGSGNVTRYALKIPNVGNFPDDATWSEWQVVASPQITIQPDNLPGLPESVVKTVNVNAATMWQGVWFAESRNGITAPPFNNFFWPAPPLFQGYPSGLRTTVTLGYSQQGDAFLQTSTFTNELSGPPGNGTILIEPGDFLPHIGGLAASGTVGSEGQPSVLNWGTSQLEWSGSTTALTLADGDAALAGLLNVSNTCGSQMLWTLLFTPTAGQTTQRLPLIPADQFMACTPGGSPTATFTPFELFVVGSSTTDTISAHRDMLTTFQELVASPLDEDGKRSQIRFSASLNAAIFQQGTIGIVGR